MLHFIACKIDSGATCQVKLASIDHEAYPYEV